MDKTRIIIAIGGFAGLSAAMYLDKTVARRADLEVTLINCENGGLLPLLCRRRVFEFSPLARRVGERMFKKNT
jgi:NADH dehydrogenase FAD-containing subunit